MFDDIIGNEKIKKMLIDAINKEAVSHSYLFVGKSGIGKKMFAIELAKHVMCLGDENCESCIKFDTNSNPDFNIITADGKSIKIDQIRSIQSKIIEKPIISSKKVYIIDNAELMSEEAQNCLLKTLEEPPEYAMIILVCSNENRMLQTIKSRCVIIKFEDLSKEQISNFLNIKDKEIISLCSGSLEKANEIKEKQDFYIKIKEIINLLEKESLVDVLKNADIIYSSKEDILNVLEYMNIIFFEKCKENIIYSKAICIVEKTKEKIQKNNNFDMSVDYMLIHIWEEFHGKSSWS